MKTFLATLVVAAFAAAPAFAQMADFATADADSSGTVSMEEAQTALPDMTEEDITAADADSSGDLSQEEYETLTAE